MGSLKTAPACLLGFLALGGNLYAQSAPPRTLYAQSAVKILERDFPKTDASFLLLDAGSGAILAEHWENYEKPIPLGSLVKPFTALAYSAAHNFVYPKLECKGKASSCWRDRAHGTLDLTSAISVSCNAYFRQLAQSVSLEQISQTSRDFHIEEPREDSESQTFSGLGDRWRISPLRMAQAYIELQRRKDQPGVYELLQGMRQSALRGTGMSVGRELAYTKALAKTGTSPCTHTARAPADGFTIVLFPADSPEIVLLVRRHGVTGAATAELVGRLLHQMER